MHKYIQKEKKTALAYFQAGRLTEALTIYESCLRTHPDDPELWYMLGLLGGKQGDYARAANCFRRVISLQPENMEAAIKLAMALRFMGSLEQAVDVYRSVLINQPDNMSVVENLAYLLFELGQKEESAMFFQKAMRAQPGKAEAHSVYGSVLHSLGRNDEAISAYNTALKLNPDLFLYPAIGNALLSQGRIVEAYEYYRKAVSMRRGDAGIGSILLMSTHYHPALSRTEIFDIHREWGENFGNQESRIREHTNSPVHDKRLRIGYVSPDLRAQHSVTYFIEPLLREHNKHHFEIFCYSVMPRPDKTTKRLCGYADHWRDVYGWDSHKLADRIVEDKVDILVDLAGHTANNSLLAFAIKPAPLQVTYLGYPNTTGLPAIDYRLTDAESDPSGAENYYVERLYRLPGSFLCYQPPPDAPLPAPSPAEKLGYITFGSFNNLAKVNTEVIQLWSDVLRVMPGSRLVIKYRSLEDPAVQARYKNIFADLGISPDRITLHGHMESRQEHLALYGSIDIALDTFPYNGTTTTCEAIWMGVPVATLAGDSHVSRVGTSLLNSVGLSDWVAQNREAFVTMLCRHGSNVRKLAILRDRLREQLKSSRLCNASGFATSVEAAYRNMWQDWCDDHMTDTH